MLGFRDCSSSLLLCKRSLLCTQFIFVDKMRESMSQGDRKVQRPIPKALPPSSFLVRWLYTRVCRRDVGAPTQPVIL